MFYLLSGNEIDFCLFSDAFGKKMCSHWMQYRPKLKHYSIWHSKAGARKLAKNSFCEGIKLKNENIYVKNTLKNVTTRFFRNSLWHLHIITSLSGNSSCTKTSTLELKISEISFHPSGGGWGGAKI